jgi:hypothetical protein
LVVTHYEHFKNIHSTIAHPQEPILCQLLYNWRSADDPTQRLFVMVEQDFEEGPTKFSYLTSLQDEVGSILLVLPLILIGRLDPAAAAWFLPFHTLGTDGYRYDARTDRVVPIDAISTLTDIYRHWEQSDEGFTGHTDIAAYDDDSYQDFAIDIGDFAMDQPSRSRILGDDTASVATLGIPPTSEDNESVADEPFGTGLPEPNAMELDADHTSDDANTTIGSSITESTQNLTLDDSLATLLANESSDPTIRQAILDSQQAAKLAGGPK